MLKPDDAPVWSNKKLRKTAPYMKKLLPAIFIVLAVALFSSCSFIGNAFKYRETTEAFVEHLLAENYNKAIGLIATDHPIAKDTNLDTLKIGLANFREIVVSNFGNKLDYKFMSAEKKWSTNE